MLTGLWRDTPITSVEFGKLCTCAREPLEGALQSPMSNAPKLPTCHHAHATIICPIWSSPSSKISSAMPSLETPHSPCRIGLTPQLSWWSPHCESLNVNAASPCLASLNDLDSIFHPAQVLKRLASCHATQSPRLLQPSPPKSA